MTQLNKITAGILGDTGNSTGEDLANVINAMIDILAASAEEGDVTVFLESLGETKEEAEIQFALDPIEGRAMAERNQLKLEQALGTKDQNGLDVDLTTINAKFNVIVGRGYFPIVGNLLIPVGSGKFKGQGSFIRRKQIAGVSSDALSGLIEYATAFMPIGGNDNDGIRTQCGSSDIGDFAVVGTLKEDGDGGNGIVTGHTPPLPAIAGPTTAMSTQQYWAAQANTFPQKRFAKPNVWEGLTSFTTTADGHAEIIVPEVGGFSTPEEVIPDNTIDIPLVRWVRAFDASGVEILRMANVGAKLGGGVVGIFAKNRQCTSRPAVDADYMPLEGEERAYHKPISEGDTTTTVVVPGGLPAGTETVEVSLYNLASYPSAASQMTPFLEGKFYSQARSSYNKFTNILCDEMPWNGWMLVDGAYNTFHLCLGRNNGLDGWYNPAGYEDLMHNTWTSCGAVNNGGWGMYLRDAYMTSMNTRDKGQWPTSDGKLVTHAKYTYIASVNDIGNFDTFGNRGGAFYFGTRGTTGNGVSAEKHFDAHNIDPFGTSAIKDKADWNPCRWSACLAVTPRAFSNDINFTTTSTDIRRNTMCKMRYLEETPADTNPDSNVYSAMSKNHITHPRSDVFGSLVETRSKSIHLLHLTAYQEHERLGGDVQSPAGSNIGEFQGLFCGQREYVFRPWVYDKTPWDGQLDFDWKMRFSAKNEAAPGAGKSVAAVADAIGITDQFIMNVLSYESKAINLKGKTLPANAPYEAFISLTNFPRGIDPEEFDWENISITMNYVYHETSKTDPGEDWDGQPPLDQLVHITNPRYRVLENASGVPYIRAEFQIINNTGSDIVFDPDTNARHWFKFAMHAGYVD